MFHRRSILKVRPERGDALAILSPHLLKALSYRLWGKCVELFFDRMDTVVVYTFVVEVVNPFETVARVCSHMVASGKS
jgi:hypothetical protein